MEIYCFELILPTIKQHLLTLGIDPKCRIQTIQNLNLHLSKGNFYQIAYLQWRKLLFFFSHFRHDSVEIKSTLVAHI